MKYAKKTGLKIINLYKAEDEPTYGMNKAQIKEYYDKLLNKIIT